MAKQVVETTITPAVVGIGETLLNDFPGVISGARVAFRRDRSAR